MKRALPSLENLLWTVCTERVGVKKPIIEATVTDVTPLRVTLCHCSGPEIPKELKVVDTEVRLDKFTSSESLSKS